MAGTKKTSRTKVINITDANKENGGKKMAKKAETTKAKTTTITPGGNGEVKLSDLKPISLSMEDFRSKSAQELTDLITVPDNRLSRERSKQELVSRIASGRIKVGEPSTLMDWTFKNVQVEGVDTDVRGVKEAKVALTQEQFDALSDAEKATYIKQYTNKRRVAESILPELIRKGMPLSPEDVVYLTNGRIAIDGVVVERQSRRQVALTDGIEFS